jgi:hypothetical protein
MWKLLDGVKLQIIPKAFRQAVEVAACFGIHLIWIDSLCVLQARDRGEADWLKYVTEMRNIYAHA